MQIGILKESGDRRVALVPKGIEKLQQDGLQFLLESGAGATANFSDADYPDTIQILSRAEVLQQADLLISIHPLSEQELKGLAADKTLVALFEPYNQTEVVSQLAALQLQAFSLDMIPRTTLAQSMDILSSMASIAGYKAVLLAANTTPRYFPMMITAAGSVKPAQVLVLGAGVAGLQAIATAKRMGAVVEAFDVRAAAKEEVKSLGAKFVEVEGAAEDQDAGGYAVEQSEDFLRRQREAVQQSAAKSDVVITTAQVRGRKAPTLVTADTVAKMKPGSVIVDLAASTGGNCELTENNKTIVAHEVTIIGDSNLAASLPQDASVLFSNNLVNFLKLIIQEGELVIDLENEIVKSALISPPQSA
ncbi:MAG: NAD(P) transhydrogenase subunit alpha [Bacteroidota bacterium]